ncbi:MAG: amino acid racemase [Candidatus Roizmanbacteria bacterium]
MGKIIGILGGMGPDATVEMYKLIIKETQAKTDQDHLHVIINSYPQIPDRTKALLGEGTHPLPTLITGAQVLEHAGADFIVIPCNTAHAFIPEMQKHLKIPILDMILETVKTLHTTFPNIQKVGLLATTGTIKTQLYHSYLKGSHRIITPNTYEQTIIMDAIYGIEGIKAGYMSLAIKQKLRFVIQSLKSRGAEAIILGCTELSLVFSSDYEILPLLNPMQCISSKVVKVAQDTLTLSSESIKSISI